MPRPPAPPTETQSREARLAERLARARWAANERKAIADARRAAWQQTIDAAQADVHAARNALRIFDRHPERVALVAAHRAAVERLAQLRAPKR